MSVSKIGEELRALGIKPSKKMGQHFLTDPGIADWMVESAGIKQGERILEIGPGLGILTERLIKKTKNIIAIEKDRRLASHLGEKLSIDVINADVLDTELPEFDKAVSNLPYQISSEITMKLLDCPFEKALLMYQKEFAQHLVAGAGTNAYSRISVMAGYKAECKIVKQVSKGSFHPMPKVESAIVQIVPRPPDFEVLSDDTFRKIVSVLFSHKNRKARNGLVSERKRLGLDKDGARRLADKLPHADRRPAKLTITELAEISNKFHELSQ